MTQKNYQTRREFLKKVGIVGAGILGGIAFPNVAKSTTREVMKDLIKRAIEPELDSLTKKIIHIESNWRYWKVGDNEDIGLMQVTPICLKEWNIHGPGTQYNKFHLFEPKINVEVGEWYLNHRIGKHYLPFYKLKPTDFNKAAAYNCGPPTLGSIGDAIKNFERLPDKTQKYINKLKKLSHIV